MTRVVEFRTPRKGADAEIGIAVPAQRPLRKYEGQENQVRDGISTLEGCSGENCLLEAGQKCRGKGTFYWQQAGQAMQSW